VLGASARGGTPYKLGLWGTAGAGKTTYLAMLFEALALDPAVIVVPDEGARTFAEDHRSEIRDRGLFPTPTQRRESLDVLSYMIYPSNTAQQGGGKDAPHYVLSFIDAPGEYYENLDGSDAVNSKITILDFLGSCDGIIFLIDPERVEGPGQSNYRRLLDTLLQRLQARSIAQNRGPFTHHCMAFCVTKVDQEPWWQDYDKPEQLAERIIGKNMFQLIERQYCSPKSYKYFALSSIGIRPDPVNPDRLLPNVEPIAPPDGSQQAPAAGQASHALPAAPPSTIRPGILRAAGPTVQHTPPTQGGPVAKSAKDAVAAAFGVSETLARPVNPRQDERRIISPGDVINPIGLMEPVIWLIRNLNERTKDKGSA